MSRLRESTSIHADIVANLVYVVVGFSLTSAMSEVIKHAKDLSAIIGMAVYFSLLVVPSALFIAYIKTDVHASWVLSLDYLYVFFLSIYAFSVAPPGGPVFIKISDMDVPLNSFSVSAMLIYAILIQIVSLVRMRRRVGYPLDRVREAIQTIDKALLCCILGLFSWSLWQEAGAVFSVMWSLAISPTEVFFSRFQNGKQLVIVVFVWTALLSSICSILLFRQMRVAYTVVMLLSSSVQFIDSIRGTLQRIRLRLLP